MVVEYDIEDCGKENGGSRLGWCAATTDEILTLVRDITEQTQAAAALGESAQRYRLASTAGAVGVWDWNFDANEPTSIPV